MAIVFDLNEVRKRVVSRDGLWITSNTRYVYAPVFLGKASILNSLRTYKDNLYVGDESVRIIVGGVECGLSCDRYTIETPSFYYELEQGIYVKEKRILRDMSVVKSSYVTNKDIFGGDSAQPLSKTDKNTVWGRLANA
jgi:hypothetical protein